MPHIRTIYNTDIPPALWMKRFTCLVLRYIAAEHGIPRGSGKNDTALNLYRGYDRSFTKGAVKFKMDLYLPGDEAGEEE